MDKLDAAIERRTQGKRPCLRDRWIAFHRLYRIAQKAPGFRDQAAIECFQVLFSHWDWVHLMEADERSVSRVHYPTCVRRTLLNTERKRRIHGERYEWLESDRRVANHLRQEKGLEMTPLEVGECRQGAIKNLRQKCAEQGIPLPDDDMQLFGWLRNGS